MTQFYCTAVIIFMITMMMMMTVMDIAVCLTDVGLQLDHFQTAVVVKLTLYKEPIV